ncbi:hypothetical protein AAG570_001188 [Ranatra chinensis]|uniref:Peptidase S1 domain-containing protein n=1 Tax=Ranatra chinensis TaxID=642074 RepID=A0ABD0YD09_9HEMI
MAGLGRYYHGRGVSLFCGSTIVTPYHAITAAHCTYQNYDPMAIIVGDHDLTRVDESRYTKVHLVRAIDHPGYDAKRLINDIALLVTSTPIEFNTYVGPACLPTAPMQIEGQWVKVTGWGHKRWKGTVSSTLNKVFLKVISIHSCSRKYYNRINTARPNQFCTYNTRKDSCQGDSGGPVTWLDPETNRYTLAGVVSYGGECASEWPGVNTDVYSFLPWINSNIASKYLFISSTYSSSKV